MSRDTSTTALDTYAVLVTGANSGVGFAICCRLIDEYLQRNLPHLVATRFVLIVTTRNQRKGSDTSQKLRQHINNLCAKEERRFPGITELWQPRVEVRAEILDLTSIVSVQGLAEKMLSDRSTTGLQKLDAIICNAGIGGWTGVNYPKAIWNILTNWVDSVSYPSFKTAGIGWVTRSQVVSEESRGQKSSPLKVDTEPPLGEVFCANVFGHYLLGYYLGPLLSTPSRHHPARIIWMSSLEAYADQFHLEDFQGLKTKWAYESSKRLTDVLALTSEMPSVSRWIDSYTSSPNASQTMSKADSRTTRPCLVRPKQYLAHPGICATGILPVPWWLEWAMTLALHAARWMGSPWHPVVAYLGAVAPVWLAMASATSLEAMEETEGKGKWGSGTDPNGSECVRRMWVHGWGWGGKEQEKVLPGRRKGTEYATAQDREAFEELGIACWKEMEALRQEWHRLLFE
ncbi:3-ketosteroid reductase-like protein [Pseudovirgaria hyperparasitica]|uniref:3-ketosteroid reductase-like protein n=1 Tax=Pseudovirgaria hyperparasitica TaxID=470096 RepID=A0A6A6VV50_9PEZI|nr:3-ketosteroid reductase-like protein [Pseudovirgaria hyperparasitica]KAF2754045.1 3-ketosteroid reductase-like protein [Pseudovirgaria hyperparasitica]